MDPVQIKVLESRIKDLELKMQAVLEDLGVDCEYTPESYKVVSKQQEGGTN